MLEDYCGFSRNCIVIKSGSKFSGFSLYRAIMPGDLAAQ